jgi:hypothetical protein
MGRGARCPVARPSVGIILGRAGWAALWASQSTARRKARLVPRMLISAEFRSPSRVEIRVLAVQVCQIQIDAFELLCGIVGRS